MFEQTNDLTVGRKHLLLSVLIIKFSISCNVLGMYKFLSAGLIPACNDNARNISPTNCLEFTSDWYQLQVLKQILERLPNFRFRHTTTSLCMTKKIDPNSVHNILKIYTTTVMKRLHFAKIKSLN